MKRFDNSLNNDYLSDKLFYLSEVLKDNIEEMKAIPTSYHNRRVARLIHNMNKIANELEKISNEDIGYSDEYIIGFVEALNKFNEERRKEKEINGNGHYGSS